VRCECSMLGVGVASLCLQLNNYVELLTAFSSHCASFSMLSFGIACQRKCQRPYIVIWMPA